MYPEDQSTSAALFKRAQRVLPGGNSRSSVFYKPYPVYAKGGLGSRIVDEDGIERIDFVNNYSSLIHGHAHPRIVEAVMAQMQRGSCFSAPTRVEIELAEILVERLPSVEQVRFANSGSEAVMMAIKGARGFTGRSKIAKCEGAYHGSYDYAEVSQGASPETWGDADRPRSTAPSRGTPQGVLDDVVLFHYNDAAMAERVITEHASDLAAVIIDPLANQCGMIPASDDFLRTIRAVTRRHGILMILDEVISFRLGHAGAQGAFGIDPDLTALGKVIGCGFPVGGIGGRADVMAVFDPTRGTPMVPHAGTLNANPVTMTAGKVALEMLTPEAFERIDALGERARAGLRSAFDDVGLPGTVSGRGSLFRLYLTRKTAWDYRGMRMGAAEAEAMLRLHRLLLNSGINLSYYGLGNVSTVHDEGDVDHLTEAVKDGLKQLRDEAVLPV